MLLSGTGSFYFRKFREDGFFAQKLKQGAISRLFVFAESALPRKVQLPFMFVYRSVNLPVYNGSIHCGRVIGMEQKVQGKEIGGEGRGTDASPAKEISLRYKINGRLPKAGSSVSLSGLP